jgi:hypothetical protein
MSFHGWCLLHCFDVRRRLDACAQEWQRRRIVREASDRVRVASNWARLELESEA